MSGKVLNRETMISQSKNHQTTNQYQAIILAAGLGTRMQKYTASCHKALLPWQGRTLLDWQIQRLHQFGIKDILVVVGYSKDQFTFYAQKYGVKLIENADFADTNMVTSMFCAQAYISKPVLLCYGDIWYQPTALAKLLDAPDDDAIAVDGKWQDYWRFRYGKVEHDLEELKLNSDEYVTTLGKDTDNVSLQQKRYVGLIKFSQQSFQQGFDIYLNEEHAGWPFCQTVPQQSYMTDLLNILIKFNGIKFKAIDIGRRWLEFDTVEDYELSLNWENLVRDAGMEPQ